MKKKMYIFLSFLLILVFFLTSCSNNQVTVKEKIDKANYVIVNIRPQFEQLYYLDLKSKLYYGDGNASDNNLYYADNHPYSNKKLGFEHFKNVDMLYPIIADKTSTPKIQRSNFIIEKEITKPKYIINILRGNGFTGNKIKIFYNRQGLPIKVQLLSRKTKKWVTYNTYSYFKSTHKEYKKKWDAYVKRIKAGEFEDE